MPGVVLNQELANDGWQATSGAPPVSVSKVLLDQNHAHSFLCRLRRLPHYSRRAECRGRVAEEAHSIS